MQACECKRGLALRHRSGAEIDANHAVGVFRGVAEFGCAIDGQEALVDWSSEKKSASVESRALRIAANVSTDGLTRSRSISEIVECDTPERMATSRTQTLRRARSCFSCAPKRDMGNVSP
jgi:hypothetical protein